MKKIIVLAACAACISVRAFPTYEPFSEYATTIGMSSSNSISLATSGLSVTNGAVVDNWLNLGFSATGGLIAGQDVQVEYTTSTPFTSAVISSACPPGYPGSPGPINYFAILPQTPSNAVGNSALLQFSKVVPRPAMGSAPQAVWVSYLIDVTGADGDNGTPGRYAGFLAQSNTVVEPSTPYPTWSSFFNSFINTSPGAPPYLSYGIRSDQGAKPYMGPCDDAMSAEQLDDITSSGTTKSLGLVSYGTAAFVVGQIVLSPTGSGLVDSNTFWVSPAVDNQSGESAPAATFGGPDSNAFRDPNYYIDPNPGVGFLHDVNGFFLQSRPATNIGGMGTYGTTYIANLIIGTTWSYVTGGPEFTNQVTGVTADYGATATLSATAVAAGQTVAYQWQKVTPTTTNNVVNGVGGAGGNATVSGATNTTGATGASLTLSGISSGDTGTYQVVAYASGTGFQLASATAVLTGVTPGPVNITTNPQPATLTVNYGGTAAFTVGFQTGSPPVNFAWYHGATMLTNGLQSDGSTAIGAQATNANNAFFATLTLSNVSYLDDGGYSLSATNLSGSTNSTAATLTVNDPYIAVEPPGGLPLEVATGATTNIPVTAYGTGVTYQWQWTNGSGVNPTQSGDLSGTTSSNLTISPAQPVDSGTYDVVVSGASGQSVTSTSTTVAVGAAPYITTQPSPLLQYLQQGGSNTWTVAAIGVAPVTYQWCEGSTANPIAGATNVSFSLVLPTNLGANILTNTYFCSASNAYGASNSSTIEVIVLPPSSAYVSAVVADGPIAFLRLDEGPNNPPNDGAIAYDTMGAHNGFYSNAVLQASGYSTNGFDTDDYAAAFGQIPDPTQGNLLVDNYVGGINGISFQSAIGTSNAFSVEAWVYLNADTNAAGIVTHVNPPLGRTQFALKTTGSGAFEFSYGINESVTNTTSAIGLVPAIATWYHVVGVLNLTTSSNILIYVNGVLSGSNTIAANDGVQGANQPIVIGAQQSYSNSTNLDYDEQLNGRIANVALYNYALTGYQVGNHYAAAVGVPPVFSSVPTNVNFDQGSTNAVTLSATATGPGSLYYQWEFDGTNIAGATTPALTISNVVATNAGTYTIVVYNVAGSNNASATLAYFSGSPIVLAGPQSRVETVGDHLAFTLTAVGSAPIYYQWLLDGTNISGATTSAIGLTNIVLTNSGTYSVLYWNSFNVSTPSTASATLQVTTNLQFLSSANLVVARVGDGVEALNTTSANTLYLDQFTPAGVYSNTIMIPDNVASTALTVAGGPPNGQYGSVLTQSANDYFLNFGGFNTLYSPATNVSGSSVFRAIGAVNAYGYYQLALDVYDLYGATNGFNSVVSLDGLDEFWTAGKGSTGGGIDFLNAPSYSSNETIPALFGSTAGTRVVGIITNLGYLAYTDAGSNPIGLWVSTQYPIPTSTNGTTAPISGIADVATNPSPDDFAVSPDGSTIYLCDDNTTNNGGGIQRFDYNSDTGYTYSYTLGTGTAVGASCLQVDFSISANWGASQFGAIVYATTAGASGNSLIKFVDNGNPNSTPQTVTVLDTANANEILRGVRFGPIPGDTVPVAIVSNPQSQSVSVGGTAVFTVVAENNGPFTYQWLLNSNTLANGTSIPGSGAVVSGAQTASLTVSGADMAANGGYYSVVVNNQSPGGSPLTSGNALLTVITLPKFATNSPLTGLGGPSPQLHFSGTAGTTYRIWGSTNLALKPITSTWTLLDSGTFSGGTDSFVISVTNTDEFYVITQP